MSGSVYSPIASAEEEGLFRLIYCSVSVEPITEALAQSILEQARSNNERLSITGMLLADELLFVQFLEGKASDVRTVFKKIAADPRHRCVVELLRQPNAGLRQYPDWSMAWGRATRDEIREIIHEAKAQLETGEFTPWAPAVGLLSVLLDSGFGEEYSQVIAATTQRTTQASAA